MRGSHAGEASSLGLDHRAEDIPAQGSLLLKMQKNGVRFTLTLPSNYVSHNRGYELACLAWSASQCCSNCIGLT